jgi:hypothetical protein
MLEATFGQDQVKLVLWEFLVYEERDGHLISFLSSWTVFGEAVASGHNMSEDGRERGILGSHPSLVAKWAGITNVVE